MLLVEATNHQHSLDDISPQKVEMATIQEFWKLSLHAYRNESMTLTQPMITIMEKFLTTNFSGMNDKATIIEKLQESKENSPPKQKPNHGGSNQTIWLISKQPYILTRPSKELCTNQPTNLA
jgi:uncharacterized protein with von Willebrand factor type A (vWA) domain